MTAISATQPMTSPYPTYGAMSLPVSTKGYGTAAYSSDSWSPALGSDSPIGLVSSVYASSVTVGAVTAAVGGASTQGVVTGAMDTFGKGFAAARKGLASTAMVGTVVGAGFSLVTNAIDVARGRSTLGAAAGRVVRDTASAAVSTIGATLVGGAATAALGAVGIVGLPLTIAGLGISVLAGVAIDAAFRRSVGNSIFTAVSGAIDK